MAVIAPDMKRVAARYARLAALCRMKAGSSQNDAVATELGKLADAYDRRRLGLG
jgi:hypothetical protein